MMFSTKAEYGVRVMVELARRARATIPCPWRRSPRTTACRWPTSSTWWRACARPGWSTRGAGSRGGYMLARPSSEITMAEVVEALEGSIAPIECISEAAGRLDRVLARVQRRTHVCPTKLLWTRVRFSIVNTLRETTLADLLRAPSDAAARERPARRCTRSQALPTTLTTGA